jgi:hypothetical protein
VGGGGRQKLRFRSGFGFVMVLGVFSVAGFTREIHRMSATEKGH